MRNKRRIARRALVRAASSPGNKSRSNCSPREKERWSRGERCIPDPEHQVPGGNWSNPTARDETRRQRERESRSIPPRASIVAELYVHLQLRAFDLWLAQEFSTRSLENRAASRGRKSIRGLVANRDPGMPSSIILKREFRPRDSIAPFN